MRYRAALFAIGLVTACTIGSGSSSDDAHGSKPTGAMCADSRECASGPCLSEGYCGLNDCGSKKTCPAGWSCESSSSFFSSGTFCQPSCAACPAGTACVLGNVCTRVPTKITVNGAPARANQVVNLDLAIEAAARAAYEVTWTFTDQGRGLPTPASGTSTHLAVTFPKPGDYRLEVTLKGGGLKDETVDTFVRVCGDDGAACGDSAGSCCGGECALERRISDQGPNDRFCVVTCPATCRPGYSCHSFDPFAGSGFPTGEFCLPDPPALTIDVNPAAPKANQPVTLTGHATSAAGLKIIGQSWFVDESTLEASKGSTLTLNPTKAETHRITFQVYDDSEQIAKQTIDVTIAP